MFILEFEFRPGGVLKIYKFMKRQTIDIGRWGKSELKITYASCFRRHNHDKLSSCERGKVHQNWRRSIGHGKLVSTGTSRRKDNVKLQRFPSDSNKCPQVFLCFGLAMRQNGWWNKNHEISAFFLADECKNRTNISYCWKIWEGIDHD